MTTTIDILGKVNLFAFCVLALACTRQWITQRTPNTRWAATAFGSLGAIGVIGLALQNPSTIGISIWLVKGLLVALILFPYFLYRFAVAFERPSPPVRLAAGLVTVTAVAWSLTLRRFAIPGLPEPPGWAAYRFIIETQWTVLFAIVAVRLWRGGRSEATVPRRRIRTLAMAAVGLNVAVFLSGVGSAPQAPSLVLATQVLSLLSAVLFFVGLAPPAWLLYVWRRPESMAFQRATGALYGATTEAELSEVLLPRAVGLVGARGAALVSPAGEIMGTHGRTDTTDNIIRIAAGTDPSSGAGIHRVTLTSGTLLLWTSPYAPFFGQAELAMTEALGLFADTVVERTVLANHQKDVEAALAYQALHDALTGLPNRNLFLDRLTQALVGLDRRQQMVSVHFLDLDRFKIINDLVDHSAGDEVLIAVAERLTEACRRGDTVARFGGDEFVVLADVSGREEALALAHRLINAMDEPFRVAGRDFTISASVGVAMADAEADPVAMVRDADAAMYRAKEAGRARVELFDEDMRVQAVQRAELERALWRSAAEESLRLFYQPIVRLSDDAVVGVEALIRWQHPRLGLLAPAAFLPIAEQSDLIVNVGMWVVGEVCRQAREWRDTVPGFDSCVTWMNVSGAQFARMDVAAAIAHFLKSTGLDAGALGLEINESAFGERGDDMPITLRALHDLGVAIAIDDFGTGFSSLGSLKRVPAHVLKIDGSFVNGVGTNPEDAAIATACVALAGSLGLATVAEAVETPDQRDRLAAIGCQFGQGYCFSPALPAAQAESYLRAHVLAPSASPAGVRR
jgi:diguanylate cyclase (GGDEF)-like protein